MDGVRARARARRGLRSGNRVCAIRWLLPAAALLLPLLLVTCSKPARAPRVLLVGIDGADWNLLSPLLARGELPNLQGLIQDGVHGPLRSYNPLLSPVIWTTIATGKGPDQHGVLDFTMPDPKTGDPIIVTSAVRRSKAFWNILSEKGLKVCIVGWWASWPAEVVNGVNVSDRMSYHAFIHTPEAEAGLVYPADRLAELVALKGSAKEIPYATAQEFMQVSSAAYAAGAELDFKNPVSHFRHIYQTMADYAAIAQHLLRQIRPDVLAVYFEGLDTAGHMYMRYAPPAYPYTTAEERQAFGGTVDAFYRYQDHLLGELLALTDQSTTVLVVSDHGFLTGRQRPIEQTTEVSYATAARWHRIDGVFIAKGPAVRKRADASATPLTCSNVSVFDITPTLLAALDLPAGSDMEGRVPPDLFQPGFAAPAPVPSYEDDAWRQNRAAAATTTEAVDEAMKERLRSLGYIGANESEANLSLRGQWSLADYFLHKGELGRAEQELAELVRRAPEWPEPYYNLGLTHMYRRDYERARPMYEKALALDPRMVDAAMNLAFVYRQLGEREAAIALLERTAQSEPYHAGPRVNLAILYREAGRLDRARVTLEEALRLNPENFGAVVQAAMTYEESRDYEKAAAYWSRALELNPQDATARKRLDALTAAGHAPSSAGR